ncbi:MAG TPA: FliM/FliN family flagellar motor C-terminal domain-containing protein [Acidobacteriaceae bacterium]
MTTNTLDASDVPAMETHPAWATISSFPTLLTVGVPLHQLRVRDLLALQAGQIIGTSWNISDDVPLSLGSVQLAWGEFDVQNGSIALRLTHLG